MDNKEEGKSKKEEEKNMEKVEKKIQITDNTIQEEKRENKKKYLWFDSYEQVPETFQRKIHPEMFPPNQEEIKKYHLEKCMRFLPFYQNSGGFFVAVFEKNEDFQIKEKQNKMYNKDPRFPYKPLVPLKKIYKEKNFKTCLEEEIYNKLGINENLNLNNLYTRSNKLKNIYFVGDSLKTVLLGCSSYLKVINAGIHVAKMENYGFRFVETGLKIISQFVKRQMQVPTDIIIKFLKTTDPINRKEFDKQLQGKFLKLQNGPAIFKTIHQNIEYFISVYIGRNNISSFIDKSSRKNMLSDLEYIANELKN